MYNYYEEQYCEPTEADEIFMEAKEKLLNSLKGTVKQHIESIKIENENLKKQIQRLELKFNETNYDLQELKKEKSKFAELVRKERLSELLKDFQVERFMVTSLKKYNQKCDKCDDERYIHYKSPLGKNQKELCDCNDDNATVYEVKSMIVTEFALNDRNTKFRIWYKHNTSDKEEYYTSRLDDYLNANTLLRLKIF
jgi:pyruvate-formate lyase